MATSSSIDFTMTRNDIITQALRTCGVLADGQEAAAEQISNSATILNMMIKGWARKGISLPLYQELVVYLTKDKQSYRIGATGDKATTASDAKKTELSVAGVATDGTITVDSDDDIAASDNIGIVLDDGTIQWTTVNGTPAANVVTLTDALTGAAAIDNHVYSYTTIANRPLEVVSARLKVNDGQENPMQILMRDDYFRLPTKDSTGQVTSVYYDPQINNGVLYVWSTSNNVKDTLLLTVQRQVEDFDVSTDNADFPVEWLEVIVWNLAARLGLKYGTPAQKRQEIGQVADELLAEAEGFDREDEIRFTVENDSY